MSHATKHPTGRTTITIGHDTILALARDETPRIGDIVLFPSEDFPRAEILYLQDTHEALVNLYQGVKPPGGFKTRAEARRFFAKVISITTTAWVILYFAGYGLVEFIRIHLV